MRCSSRSQRCVAVSTCACSATRPRARRMRCGVTAVEDLGPETRQSVVDRMPTAAAASDRAAFPSPGTAHADDLRLDMGDADLRISEAIRHEVVGIEPWRRCASAYRLPRTGPRDPGTTPRAAAVGEQRIDDGRSPTPRRQLHLPVAISLEQLAWMTLARRRRLHRECTLTEGSASNRRQRGAGSHERRDLSMGGSGACRSASMPRRVTRRAAPLRPRW